MIEGINTFWIDGEAASGYGIIMTEPPKIQSAERDVEQISIPGRNGDLQIDNGRYKNIHMTYKCALLPEYGDFRRDAVAALRFLRSTGAYRRVEDTYYPGHFRMARISSGVSIGSIAEQAGEFEVHWDCKPERYTVAGEKAQTFRAPAVLHNQYGFPALPIIKIYGSGNGFIKIGAVKIPIRGMVDNIILDCDLQKAFRLRPDGTPEPADSHIYAPYFPQLLGGGNAISWAGGVDHVEITPRWWTL